MTRRTVKRAGAVLAAIPSTSTACPPKTLPPPFPFTAVMAGGGALAAAPNVKVVAGGATFGVVLSAVKLGADGLPMPRPLKVFFSPAAPNRSEGAGAAGLGPPNV